MMSATYSQAAKKVLRCGIALAAVTAAAPALAQNIDTVPSWNGTSFISSWGVPNTATYGQTITPTAQQGRLQSFTFYLSMAAGTAPQYQAMVYQWDPVNLRITGNALYTSGALTAPTGSAYTPVTINTGNLRLPAGLQYVLFFTTSTFTGQANATYRYGALTGNTTYPGGQFVFFNNGTNFGQLSTGTWSFISQDLAFSAIFLPNSIATGLVNAPINPTNVANAIDKFVDGGGTVGSGFNGLYFLSGQQLVSALSQLTGENNTQAQQSAFQMGTSFLATMLNPLGDFRQAPGGAGFGAVPFAPERTVFTPELASAYAGITKAPPMAAAPGPRFDAWAAGFGGTNRARGDAAVVGSNDSTTRTGGIAGGFDYRITPDTMLGFALAGGATNWSLSSAMGGGKTDVFQVGGYGAHKFGQFYVSGAGAYSFFDAHTDRTVTVAGNDVLRADFKAHSLSGRLEGGYHINFQPVVLTPYAAVQGQSFRSPAYVEVAAPGSSNQFALAFASRTATSFRGEVGSWANANYAMSPDALLSLYGRGAFAFDRQSDPMMSATFTGLPTATFIVNGAPQARNLALATAGAELRFRNGVSLGAKFDGEFGRGSETYTGTGRLRYTW